MILLLVFAAVFHVFIGRKWKHLAVCHSGGACWFQCWMGLLRPTGKEPTPSVSAHTVVSRYGWNVWVIANIPCVTFGDFICVPSCCSMNSSKTRSSCIHVSSGFSGGEKKALHLLKGRQYSIMCQNRIKGLLKPRPCQRKMLYFAYAAHPFLLVSV